MKSARIPVLLVSLALLASACGGGGTSVASLEPGDCLNEPTGLEEIATVDRIDCTEPHDLEVFHVGNIGIAGTYPGQEALEDAGFEICEGPLFETYVGRPYLDSELYATFYVPTAESWAQGDYEIICLVHGVEDLGEGLVEVRLSESVRGSGR